MGFTGYKIFPGFREIGVVNEAVRELAVNFNVAAILALAGVLDDDLKWTDCATGVTPAIFRGKVVLDLTALDGFEQFTGTRNYKQVEVAALQIDDSHWTRDLEWPIRYDDLGNMTLGEIYNSTNWARALVDQARVMKARLAATVLMQGTPSTNKALVYVGNSIPGAGLPLFSSAATTGAHFANPLDAKSRKFDNYHPAAGKIATAYKQCRKDMRSVPSPTMSAETLGMQVTDVVGPTIMEEEFRELAIANLILSTASVGGTGVGAAVSNIYTAATTPCNFYISPALDADPYVAANPGKQMWMTFSRKRVGVNAVEMVAPTKEFTPIVKLFGDGSETASLSGMVRLIGDLYAGAAAGLPHGCQRYEET